MVSTPSRVNPTLSGEKKTDSFYSSAIMDLATLKEENQLAPGALISQVFAPRYMTRSRAASDGKTEVNISSTEILASPESVLAEEQSTKDHTPALTSEWETSSDTQAPSSETLAIDSPTGPRATSMSSSRKRGRHKEYTAPTGVWKTNGGYISTIYVGNRRIYGPLRENPEEAGVDRQKLIEAKAFAKTEADMRSFIATLKSSASAPIANNRHTPTPLPRDAEVKSVQPKRRRPLLTTCTSSTTIIESTPEPASSG